MAITPNVLLDTIIAENNLKNDAAISRILKVAPPLISRIRAGKQTIGATLIIRLHEAFPIEVKRLKELAGLPSLERYVAPAEPEPEAAAPEA